jgi:hypothetical protein
LKDQHRTLKIQKSTQSASQPNPAPAKADGVIYIDVEEPKVEASSKRKDLSPTKPDTVPVTTKGENNGVLTEVVNAAQKVNKGGMPATKKARISA